jgi:hypothetical protein
MYELDTSTHVGLRKKEYNSDKRDPCNCRDGNGYRKCTEMERASDEALSVNYTESDGYSCHNRQVQVKKVTSKDERLAIRYI